MFNNICKHYLTQGPGLHHMVCSQDSGLKLGLMAKQDLAPKLANMEFLDLWGHPKCLLRMHVRWPCTVFIRLREDFFAAAWFDEAESFSFWRVSTGPVVTNCELLRFGLIDLCRHLSMLGNLFRSSSGATQHRGLPMCPCT